MILGSSPRLWGCFSKKRGRKERPGVFPTLVGVFPPLSIRLFRTGRLPHACGGVSASIQLKGGKDESSPRLWGCFQEFRFRAPRALVFPTLVGVFPPDCSPGSLKHGLPHACGGVSFVKLRRCRAMSGRSRCPS